MPLNDFEIGKQLGNGAFGSVYLVKRKRDQKTYAMKRVKISQLSAKEIEYALNEIRLLASLTHQNIIGYNEAFFDDPSKTINIVMEFANDGDWGSKIKYNQEKRLICKESSIWPVWIQVLQGWKYWHDNKIIHRDWKPANWFWTKNGAIKIGDWNVSKLTTMGLAKTQTGTPYYASPEIWKDKPYNLKTDIWSVGCIIYEMCTLKPPFRGTSLKNLYDNINIGKYPEIPKMYSSDWARIIKMMLQVNADLRPNCDQLLKMEIIQEKMKDTQLLVKEDNEEKIDLIKTIKKPRNMKEINRMLPNQRYDEEMGAHDEYETKKNFSNPRADKDTSSGPTKPDTNESSYNQRNKPQNDKKIVKNYNYINNNHNNKDIEKEAEQKRIQRANYMKKEQMKDNKNVDGNKWIDYNQNQRRQEALMNRPSSGVNKKPIAIQKNILIKKNNNEKWNNGYKSPSNAGKSPLNQIYCSNNKPNPQCRPSSGKAIGHHNINNPRPSGNAPVAKKVVASNANPVKKKPVIEKINYQQYLIKNNPKNANNSNSNKKVIQHPQSAQPRRTPVGNSRPVNSAYRPKIMKK